MVTILDDAYGRTSWPQANQVQSAAFASWHRIEVISFSRQASGMLSTMMGIAEGIWNCHTEIRYHILLSRKRMSSKPGLSVEVDVERTGVIPLLNGILVTNPKSV